MKMSNENIPNHVYGTPKLGHVSGIQMKLDLCGSGTLILVSGSVVEPEPEPSPKAEEPKINCLLEPEPQLRIAAPAPFYYRLEKIS
jgi:hypothetical protein